MKPTTEDGEDCRDREKEDKRAFLEEGKKEKWSEKKRREERRKEWKIKEGRRMIEKGKREEKAIKKEEKAAFLKQDHDEGIQVWEQRVSLFVFLFCSFFCLFLFVGFSFE